MSCDILCRNCDDQHGSALAYQIEPKLMRMKTVVLTSLCVLIAGCASDLDRRTAKLEKELNIQGEPVFPKCAVQEIDPKVGSVHSRVGSGISQTIYDPIGSVPLDECVAYEHEVPGKDP